MSSLTVTLMSFSSTPGSSTVTSSASLPSATSIFGASAARKVPANGVLLENSSNDFSMSRNSDCNEVGSFPNTEGRNAFVMTTS